MGILTQTLGYPRIGENRELKKELEGYWSGKIDEAELQRRSVEIRRVNWEVQRDAGIDLIPSNDFSLYDHVLDTSCLVGAVPYRYNWNGGTVDLETYFAMARGVSNPEQIQEATHTALGDVIAMEMTKWFDTNYHYIVPEFEPSQTFRLSSTKPFDEFQEALALGIKTKPVLLGPVSYLMLGKCAHTPFDRLTLLPNLLPVYQEVLQKLSQIGAEWVQMDEPVLVMDLEESQREAFRLAYHTLHEAAPNVQLMLGTYFGELHENYEMVIRLPVAGVHLDFSERGSSTVPPIPQDKVLSMGVVDGRNVWKNDFSSSLHLLERAKKTVGSDRLIIAPSCSLLHCPVTLESEEKLGEEIRGWLAFSKEKLYEVMTLRTILEEPEVCSVHLKENQKIMEQRKGSSLIHDPLVKHCSAKASQREWCRFSPIEERKTIQRETLSLPLFPTTTIGSFPQTKDVRTMRSKWEKKEISEEEYRAFIRRNIWEVIELQKGLDLDVLVHGESERNDMVQYFGEQLNGFSFTEHGWVQSYGSRYVRPPVIYGDVSRKGPMTVEWARFAQSLTEKPVKGMLTGPVTMLHWSFVRDDQPESETCRQIALTLREEVLDLEHAGIQIIQIDEPALREGLPLRTDQRDAYLRWATESFRIATADVCDETQIHTHMCYAEFQDILDALREMDMDVISLEAARSRATFLETLAHTSPSYDIGPGVWDIHSPRIPTVEEMVDILRGASSKIPSSQLWVNPDCGLKTRSWAAVVPALSNMVEAAKILRLSL